MNVKAVSGLGKGLHKSREGWFSRVVSLFDRATVAQPLWDDLEELLISADVGMATTGKLIDRVRERAGRDKIGGGDRVLAVLKEEMTEMLDVAEPSPSTGDESTSPRVILVVGVNGTGKTLSIAKLAASMKAQGKDVIIAAADTFRAAAIDQNPGAVVFDSLEAARARNADAVIIDTAGRVHTKYNLMEELKKIKRVASRIDPGAPHEVLLVLDATTGQNGLVQARRFTEAVDVSGIFLTKLDGTARGGIVLAICDELKIPIRFIGTGESVDDIAPFDAQAFVEELSAC